MNTQGLSVFREQVKLRPLGVDLCLSGYFSIMHHKEVIRQEQQLTGCRPTQTGCWPAATAAKQSVQVTVQEMNCSKTGSQIHLLACG